MVSLYLPFPEGFLFSCFLYVRFNSFVMLLLIEVLSRLLSTQLHLIPFQSHLHTVLNWVGVLLDTIRNRVLIIKSSIFASLRLSSSSRPQSFLLSNILLHFCHHCLFNLLTRFFNVITSLKREIGWIARLLPVTLITHASVVGMLQQKVIGLV